MPETEWPPITLWIVNGEEFTSLDDAADYADRLERRGEEIQFSTREDPQ